MFRWEEVRRIATRTTYEIDVRRILHDATATYWPSSDLWSFINRAMQQRDRDTGVNRAQASFPLTVGQNTYPLANLSLLYPDGTTPTGTVFDVMGIVLIYGNARYQLPNVAYTDLVGIYQPYTAYRQVPQAFCLYGAKYAMIAPAPVQAYETIWDCVLISAPLVSETDEDPMPDPWTDPVPFLACAFAKDELGQSDEAEKYRKIYAQRLLSVNGSRIRQLSHPYSDMVVGRGGWG